MPTGTTGRPSGACNIKPSKAERELIIRQLKAQALDGDPTASLALASWLSLHAESKK